MKKLTTLIAACLFSVFALAQYPFFTPQGAVNNQWYNKGSFGVDGGFVFRTNFSDTTSLNSQLYIPGTAGILVRVGDNLFLRNNAATRWNQLLTSNNIGTFGWSLTGNAGTTAGTNFIGTTDNTPLAFKVNNILSGYIGTSASVFDYNTFFGYGSGTLSATNGGNVGIGLGVLPLITGGGNTAVGTLAMAAATTAEENTALGSGALGANRTGFRNTAIGEYSLYQGWGGLENVMVGHFGGELNSGGSYNSGLGGGVLRSNKMGAYNNGLGHSALLQNTTTIGTIAIATPGSGQTDGTHSLTISAPEAGSPGGVSAQATATVTISGGVATAVNITNPGAGYSTEKGAVTATISQGGTPATFTVTLLSGSRNTGIGHGSFAFTRTGFGNVGLGYHTGLGVSNNAYGFYDSLTTMIGYGAARVTSLSNTESLTNATAIGANAKVGCDNCLVLGDTTTAVNVGIGTAFPSARLDVTGTLRFRNGATNGYVLTSDGSGNATWQAIPASSPEVNNGLVKNSSNVIQLDSNGVNPLTRNVLIDADGNDISFENIGQFTVDGASLFNGELTVDDNVVPLNDNAATLGLPAQRWAALYSGSILNSSSIQFTAGSNSLNWGTNGVITIPDVSSPLAPASGFGAVYVNGDSLRFKNDAGTEFTLGRGGSGSVAWNDIVDPTGDQALTFDAGESSTWTNSNTTEDLLTINSSTVSSSSYLSLNRTSTALAAGNNILELISSGANGTSSITATGLNVSVTNTGTTSTNYGLNIGVSGASTNYAIFKNAGTYNNFNGVWISGSAPGYFQSSNATGQTVVGHSIGNGANSNYTLSKIVWQTSGNDRANITSTGSNFGTATAATSTLQTAGSFGGTYTATATGITLDATHFVVNVTATGQTITLPTAVGITGRIYTIKLTASGTGTVGTTSSQNIDASTTYSLSAQYKFVTVQSDGANWIIIGQN